MKIGRFMQKKSVVAALCGIVLVGIGATWAFSHDLSVMNNNLALANYQVTYTEEFVSPDNWQTCQTVPKTVTVTNNSGVDVAVRIKLEEDWIASDGTTHLPLTSAASGLVMAQTNFTENSGWTRDGEYFVYDTDLAPNATTSSLITGVTLNCDANLNENADGAYAGAEYHLKATIQTIQADMKSEWSPPSLTNMIASRANAPYEINFARKALASNDLATANGNGVNKFTENGADIYYYRGDVSDNNVIWADMCWKIVRTTATGGTKIIYNGEPSVVDGVKQCNATGMNATINGGATYRFNNYRNSPADIGYKYGTRVVVNSQAPGSTTYVFSNDVSRNGNTYTLDTSTGQSVTGTWVSTRIEASSRYHYFCTNGAASCDSTRIGYILSYYFNSGSTNNYIYYLPVGGYKDIEAVKTAMFANTNDSNAKTVIENWFETKNLDGHIAGSRNYEDDLEDAIFCNDRSIVSGALQGKDSNASPVPASGVSIYPYFGAHLRNYVKNSQGNVEPSLDCPDSKDSFQVSNNAAKLKHKAGLITADELTLAGAGLFGHDPTVYLNTGSYTYSLTVSPDAVYSSSASINALYDDQLNAINADDNYAGLRPMVSLKAGTVYVSGTGLKTDPYIVP